MGRFPELHTNTKWGETPAREWRNLIDAVRRWDNLRVGTGLKMAKSGRGVKLDLAEDIAKPHSLNKRVAIFEVAEDAETTVLPLITMREVRYNSLPPIEGDYKWNGPKFQGWPDVGTELDEFRGLVWGDANPTIDTPIITARRVDDEWFCQLSAPGGAERLVVLREFGRDPETGEPDQNSQFATVQEVQTVIVNGLWTGAMETVGNPVEIAIWPGLVAGDFAPFRWVAEDVISKTTYLPLTRYRGVWFLKQRRKVPVSRRQGPIKVLDCAKVEP